MKINKMVPNKCPTIAQQPNIAQHCPTILAFFQQVPNIDFIVNQSFMKKKSMLGMLGRYMPSGKIFGKNSKKRLQFINVQMCSISNL